MTREEKLEEAKRLYKTANADQRYVLESLFPELAESEGERIRKAIINTIEDCSPILSPEVQKRMIAWLEKQGEQKPVDKVEPKFNVGDWVIFKDKSVYKVKNIHNYEYTLQHILGGTMPLPFSSKNLIRPWTIEDAKDGDVLYSLDSKQPFIYKDRLQFSQARGYCCINKFGEFAVWYTSKCVICTDKYIPATKEQRDLLFAKMKEAGYTFDSEKKELKKISQRMISAEAKETLYDKPTWSEEDEHRAKDTIYFLDTAKKHYASTVELDACIDWLKSIKQKLL